jgi:hypothetical protein
MACRCILGPTPQFGRTVSGRGRHSESRRDKTSQFSSVYEVPPYLFSIARDRSGRCSAGLTQLGSREFGTRAELLMHATGSAASYPAVCRVGH